MSERYDGCTYTACYSSCTPATGRPALTCVHAHDPHSHEKPRSLPRRDSRTFSCCTLLRLRPAGSQATGSSGVTGNGHCRQSRQSPATDITKDAIVALKATLQLVQQLLDQSASYTEQQRTCKREMQKLSHKVRVLVQRQLDETVAFHRKHMRAWHFRELHPQVLFAERPVLAQQHLTELTDVFEQLVKLMNEFSTYTGEQVQKREQLRAVVIKLVDDIRDLAYFCDSAAVELLMFIRQSGGDVVSAPPHQPTPTTPGVTLRANERKHAWEWKPMHDMED